MQRSARGHRVNNGKKVSGGQRLDRVLPLASIVAGLLAWQLAAGRFSAFILPPPLAVVVKLWTGPLALQIITALGHSALHMLVGFGLALVVAIPLGLAMGRSALLHDVLNPIVNAFYALPAVAFVPFLIIWFGLFFEARAALVFLMSVPDMLVVIAAGARDLRRPLLDVGRSFGASRLQIAVKIMLPATLPFMFAAYRVGFARAINGMITAELFFAAVNLGALLKSSAEHFDGGAVLLCVIAICLVGLAAQALLGTFERRVLHWHVRR
jgi:ABC-type nitrate/sulfonate/bicarbonate transport system permease component